LVVRISGNWRAAPKQRTMQLIVCIPFALLSSVWLVPVSVRSVKKKKKKKLGISADRCSNASGYTESFFYGHKNIYPATKIKKKRKRKKKRNFDPSTNLLPT
jgi:hypothetical protein